MALEKPGKLVSYFVATLWANVPLFLLQAVCFTVVCVSAQCTVHFLLASFGQCTI